jgi:hypothetical protein
VPVRVWPRAPLEAFDEFKVKKKSKYYYQKNNYLKIISNEK